MWCSAAALLRIWQRLFELLKKRSNLPVIKISPLNAYFTLHCIAMHHFTLRYVRLLEQFISVTLTDCPEIQRPRDIADLVCADAHKFTSGARPLCSSKLQQ